MAKNSKSKEEYNFLKVGYTSFPLKDIDKKFEVLDTMEIRIKKTKIMELEKGGRYIKLHIAHREIEEAIWKEIKKDKTISKRADWLVISMINDFGKDIGVSLDMLKGVSN